MTPSVGRVKLRRFYNVHMYRKNHRNLVRVDFWFGTFTKNFWNSEEISCLGYSSVNFSSLLGRNNWPISMFEAQFCYSKRKFSSYLRSFKKIELRKKLWKSGWLGSEPFSVLWSSTFILNLQSVIGYTICNSSRKSLMNNQNSEIHLARIKNDQFGYRGQVL